MSVLDIEKVGCVLLSTKQMFLHHCFTLNANFLFRNQLG